MKKIINSTINFVDQINWHEVGQAIVKAIAFTYTLGYCLGLWVHRTNAQLSAAHVAVLGLQPTAIVTAEPAQEPAKTEPAAALAVVQHPLIEIAAQLERLTVRELQAIIGTKQKLAKRQLINAYLQMA
jgi:hypothetical protein